MHDLSDLKPEEYFKEGVHYALQLPEDAENDQAWDVRILEGDFLETVVRFGNVAVDDTDDTRLNFNFMIQYTPDTILTEENEELQEYCARVLTAIIADAISNDELVTSEKVDDGKD